MSMMDSSWNGHGQDHPIQSGSGGDDVFQQFMDINGLENLGDGLNFGFPEFSNANGGGHNGNNMLQDPNQNRQTLDTPMTGTDTNMVLSTSDPTGLHHHMPSMNTGISFPPIPTTAMIAPPTQTGAIVNNIEAQIQFLQQQKLQHQQRELQEQQATFFAQHIPPTPTSLELAPAAHNYYAPHSQGDHTPQHQALDYNYRRSHDQQEMSFTPLVSPAVTPLETHFPMDTQFTVPGAYFSPLTSPALHAQNDNSPSTFGHMKGNGGPGSSPAKIDFDASTIMAFNGSNTDSYSEQLKKLRKPSTKRTSSGGVRQSPITKPQRRKAGTTPIINEQALIEAAEANQEQQNGLPMPALPDPTYLSTDSDHNSSVSPEALNDNIIEMPPPPKPKRPRSGKPSPYIAAQHHAQSILGGGMPSPATPASLMKLSSPRNGASDGTSGGHELSGGAVDHIDNFELPDSINFPKQAENGNGARRPIISTSGASSAAGSVFQPMPSPVVARPMSATQSPLLTPGSGSVNGKKTPLLAARGSRKRASFSGMTVPISPALRPKISPNIKPLLLGAGGTTADDTASLLLATKSNYQRILEGSTVGGMSYPSELSTNLTSKRTSHKIAEQGRRNRMNVGLIELANLLPKLASTDKESKEVEAEAEANEKKDKSGNTPNSKAETVELAIEYIKQLRKELDEANRRAEEAGRKLEATAEE